jgi:hypothetical protein
MHRQKQTAESTRDHINNAEAQSEHAWNKSCASN